MSSLPLTEAIMLEVYQSLVSSGSVSYQTIQKNKFATAQDSLSAHSSMGQEILNSIFDALDMSDHARYDAINNLTEFGSAYKQVELNTWTYEADSRQILWMLLGYLYTPVLARRMAFWSIQEPIDQGMPGGRFWYLPEPREVDGKSELYPPAAQVLDWLLDLLGTTLEEFANQRSEATDGVQDGLVRTLYNWRKGTTPELGTIEKYFSNENHFDFKGAFSLNSTASSEQFAEALLFVTSKQLTADQLRLEISMTEPGRIEALLDGNADDEEKAVFVEHIARRYAVPSSHTIRQRLLIARMVQDGYSRLLKFLCPGVDRQCADAKQNKLLQIFAIYRLVYNKTVEAWSTCKYQGEQAENAWFEAHLPPADRQGIFLCILPSHRETANLELAHLLTRHFSAVQAGAALEDHVGLDEESEFVIFKRNTVRSLAFADELSSEMQLIDRMRTSSPWRALQGEHRYSVVGQVAHQVDFNPRAKEAAIQRLRELSTTPALTVQTILLELNGYLNGGIKKLPKDACERVQRLIDEAESSEGYELWKAPILQYKAKHLLASNDFDGAGKLFRKALEAASERNFGPVRGEVAQNCLALAVANQRLIPENHEKYYREMLAGGRIEGHGMPVFEDVSRVAADYFWGTLYKPYPGVERRMPLAMEQARESIKLLMASDHAGLLKWIECNRSQINARMPLVTGDSLLMLWIKTLKQFQLKLPGLKKGVTSELLAELNRFEAMLEFWRQSVAVLIQQAPKQLNIGDFKKQTPLILMAETGDTEMVKEMLKAGADPEVQDWHGMTALHSAIKSQVNSCVDALLDHPCKLDKVTKDGRSPLHTAAWSANHYATKRILELAPELAWKRDDRGHTPLEFIEFLIEQPEALSVFAQELAINGRRCASRQELVSMVKVLEQATPAASV